MPFTINGKTVNKISGPVAMHLLTPTDEYLKIYPYAPLYILFGDRHKDLTGFCTDQSIENGSYNIYDPDFLKLFSDAVNKKEDDEENGTIDFYVEGGVYGDLHITERELKKQNYPLKEIINLFVDCYNNTRMPNRNRERGTTDEIKSTCNKIPNIRWQSGDIRFSLKSKGNMSMLLYKLKTNTQNDLKSSLIENLQSKILKRGHTVDLSTFPFTIGEYITKYLNDNLITKQLNKINNDSIRGKIISKFKIYIEKVHSNVFKDLNDDKLKELIDLHNIFRNASTQLYSREFNLSIFDIWKRKDMLPTYSNIMMKMDSLLLDLYSLARSYKTMSKYMNEEKEANNKYPIINICYFGNTHTTNINDFLTTIAGQEGYNGGYVGPTITNLDKVVDIRCLNINTNTNLDDQIIRIKRIRKNIK